MLYTVICFHRSGLQDIITKGLAVNLTADEQKYLKLGH